MPSHTLRPHPVPEPPALGDVDVVVIAKKIVNLGVGIAAHRHYGADDAGEDRREHRAAEKRDAARFQPLCRRFRRSSFSSHCGYKRLHKLVVGQRLEKYSREKLVPVVALELRVCRNGKGRKLAEA